MSPRTWLAAWDALPHRQRLAAAIAALAVAIAIVMWFIAGPLADANARRQADVARERLVLQVARDRAIEDDGLARASASPATRDVRSAVTSVLARFAVQATPAASAAQEGRYAVVVAQARFDALVAALDALAREEGVQVVEATVTARVEPGAVRAELTLGR